MLRLSSPITVAAGPRGQFVDLIKLMRLVCTRMIQLRWDAPLFNPNNRANPNDLSVAGKEPPATKYLFLGGYTERGGTGLQCFLLLLALKVGLSRESRAECEGLNYGLWRVGAGEVPRSRLPAARW